MMETSGYSSGSDITDSVNWVPGEDAIPCITLGKESGFLLNIITK
jgi:hypothetical protein